MLQKMWDVSAMVKNVHLVRVYTEKQWKSSAAKSPDVWFMFNFSLSSHRQRSRAVLVSSGDEGASVRELSHQVTAAPTPEPDAVGATATERSGPARAAATAPQLRGEAETVSATDSHQPGNFTRD